MANSNIYFGSDTEDAISEWLKATSQSERDMIFTEHIYPVFHLMADKLVHKFKFYPPGIPHEEICSNIVTHLYERGLPKLDQQLGKAYSYCTRCTINYILAKRQEYYTKSIDKADVIEIDRARNVYNEMHQKTYQDDLSIFIDLWVAWYDAHIYELYEKEKCIKIVDAILEIFRSRKGIEVFQKKLLYILIRERAKCSTSEITPIVKKVRAHFADMYKTYKSENKIALYNYH